MSNNGLYLRQICHNQNRLQSRIKLLKLFNPGYILRDGVPATRDRAPVYGITQNLLSSKEETIMISN